MVWFDAFVILALAITSTIVTVSDNVSDIERDSKALELFLQDKKDHKDHCPNLKWDQPTISKYKATLKSHLPEGCKS